MLSNHLPKALKPYLPPTDSRLRPDLRLHEQGKIKESDTVKKRLYKLQDKRKLKLANEPRWFTKQKHPKDDLHPFYSLRTGPSGYWEKR